MYDIEFDFELGGVVILNCTAYFHFGKLDHVEVKFNGVDFDTDGIVIDWEGEFLPMSESIMIHATQEYKRQRKDRL